MTAGVMMSRGSPATTKSPTKSAFGRLLGQFHRCVQQDCVEDRNISFDEKPSFSRMTTVTVTLRKRCSSKEPRPKEVNVDIDRRRYSLRYRSGKANGIHVPRLRPHSFVNSQEWTLSRSIVDLKLGVLGTVNSGKSALVHRYLTGAYVQEESPEGGRFKKEIVIDSQSYLLLIRDEAGLPEQQFSQWVDAVIFVFSLENERSFAAIYSFYAKMAHYLANLQDIPIILVGTQDAISESNPRLIDDSRARKLASDLRRCSYYETCATYGLNVERVFQDACLKILQSRMAMNPTASIRSSTPNHMTSMRPYYPPQPPAPPVGITSYDSQSQTSSGSGGGITLTPTQSGHHIRGLSPPFQDVTNVRDREPRESRADRSDRRFREPRESRPTREFREPREHWDAREPRERRDMRDVEAEMALLSAEDIRQRGYRHSGSAAPALPSVAPEPPPRRPMRSVTDSPSAQVVPSLPQDNQAFAFVDAWNVVPCTSTPLLSRKFSMTSADDFVKKGLRKSESFSKADDDKNLKSKNGELGIGRVIPLKQGFLYKKSSKPLSKEWKKKYVTLLDDGRLTYHPSLHDYMNNVKGKEISLVQTTVKIPGKRPRGSEMPKTNPQFSGKPTSLPNTGAEAVGAPPDSSVISNSSLAPELSATPPMSGISPSTTAAKPDVKKRQRRTDGETSEFMVVSLENVTWHFDASSLEERDEWVDAIQQQIMTSLQLLSSGPKNGNAVVTDRAVIQEIRSVAGNSACADCDALDPSWASLNLGILVCIECSGIHRNLGTHLSRIRSLDLDEWPPDTIVVMTSIGNQLANSIWEANTKGLPKPKPTSPRDEKEKWIQSKYKLKEFLPPLPFDNVPYTQQLIDAVARQLIERTILVLAYCNSEHINAPYSKTDTRTALHIASALGNSVLIQLLIWYGANVKVLDHEGHNPLFYARSAGAVDCVELLLANGCLDNPTLPRRRTPNLPAGNTANTPSNDTFNKLPTSII